MTILTDAADELLAVCVALLAANPFDRSYVSPGPPTHDCSQITVHIGSMVNAGPGVDAKAAPIHRGGAIPTPTLVVTTLRCITVWEKGDIPTAATLQAEGELVHDDLSTLWYGLATAIGESTLFADRGCSVGRMRAQPVLPTQVAGWQISLEVTMT